MARSRIWLAGVGVLSIFIVSPLGCDSDSVSSAPDRWDFTDASVPRWTSSTGRVKAIPSGLLLLPKEQAVVLSSGPTRLAMDQYAAVRLHLVAWVPLEGRLELVIETSDGMKRHSVPFVVQGGGSKEEIRLALDDNAPRHGILRELILVPSITPQRVVVASVAMEPLRVSLQAMAILEEIMSRKPGVNAARRTYAINWLDPPSAFGRSVWAFLAPVVFVASILAFLTRTGVTRWQRGVRAAALGSVVGVWVLGLLFLLFHQGVAMTVDLSRFRGDTLVDKYHTIDGLPLWEDIQDVAPDLQKGAAIEFVFVMEGKADSSTIHGWSSRAAYYLAPFATITTPAQLRLLYFGSSHRPCAEISPDLITVRDAERFCLFRIRP